MEILERCNVFVQNKRTIKYTRRKKSHKVLKATSCVECYQAHIPTVTCRMDHKHLGCNVTITETKINTAKGEEKTSVANMCKENDLLECCIELVILTFSYTPPQVAEKQKVMPDYATGYILDFTNDRFSKWTQMFESQTQSTAYKGEVTRIETVIMD